MVVVISSGHGKFVSGASGLINEVTEARRVVPAVAEYLRSSGVSVIEFHDDSSKTQNENLNTIVGFHNKQARDLDVSVHFNAYMDTTSPRGTEVLYYTESELAGKVSKAISNASGLINRGPKKRTELAFLSRTTMSAILIEVCFVDSSADVLIYRNKFDSICKAIAEAISGIKPASSIDIGSVSIKVDGGFVTSIQSILKDGSNFTNLRQLANATGYEVGWDAVGKLVTLDRIK